jgi:hypothetical protein
MKRLGFLGSFFGKPTATVVALAGALAATLSTRGANAGCGDGTCGRVDWTEVTASNQGTAVAAKLHGAFTWEASPDGWVTHPIGGTLSGYVWLSCVPPGDSGPVETTCTDQLASEMAKAGTITPLRWGGTNNFDSTTMKPIVPKGLYAEGQPGAPEYLIAFPLGGEPLNQAVCPTALAFGKDAGAHDAGAMTGSDAAASSDGPVSGTGGASSSSTGDGSTGRSGGANAGGASGAGGSSAAAGGAKTTGGVPRSNMTGNGDQPSGETGGFPTAANAAADAGGGCRITTVASSSRSGPWLFALAIAFASARRSRAARQQVP